MTFNIETAILSEEDAARLYVRFPELRTGPCPTCRNTGHYRWAGTDHECNCRQQRQLAKHYSMSGVGVKYQRLDWSDFVGDESALQQISDYILKHEQMTRRGMGLLLSGPLGTGKTFLANMVLKELIKRGYNCWATTFANTIEAFTATWGNQEEKQWFARRFMYSQVLLLDDLGRDLRTGNNLPQSTFDSILRTRVQEGRTTLVTTNMSMRELETGYGSAVLSLLKEVSLRIEFTGSDFRPRANARTMSELDDNEIRPIT